MSPIRKALIVLSILLAGVVSYDLATFNRAAWQADYGRLKAGMAQGYANLDWQVEKRNLDLPALDRRTDERLSRAVSHLQAYLALRDFIGAFRDPHLSLARGAPPPGTTPFPMQSALVPTLDCSDEGFENEEMASDLAYASLPDFTALDTPYFPAGIVGDIAIVRIAAFGENKYLAACREAQAEAAATDPRALQLATRERLNASLEDTLKQLKDMGTERLVIDVTGNGGGSEWIGEIAAMLSDRPLSREAPRLAVATCDRAAIWDGEKVCPILAASGDRETVDGLGLWTGPIVLLIDHRSASATEGFVAWLSDNDRATLLGTRTFGAGCGYIDGGSAVALTAAPLHVMMPNCARFTGAGINEIEGIAPDLETDLHQLEVEDYPALFERAFALP